MKKCNFCSKLGNCLKLKPDMLRQLGVREGLEYWACEAEFDPEALFLGKRRRWADGASLNVGPSDIVRNEEALEGLVADHKYARPGEDEEDEDEDFSQDAVDLRVGQDTFMDSQSLDYREETVGDEDCSLAEAGSQVGMRCYNKPPPSSLLPPPSSPLLRRVY